MTATSMTTAYGKYYAARAGLHVYPVEFVVRTFLGKYPDLALNAADFAGQRILDLGYGDGRNMPLFANLGMNIHGIEISNEINAMAAERMRHIGIEATLATGHNAAIPFADEYFDTVVACHSCYYVNEGQSFDDNLAEIARVLRRGGLFVCSLPFSDTYILRDAEVLAGGHYRITHDPYGLRSGTIFRAFSSRNDVEKTLADRFYDMRIGYCDDNFYGIHQRVWIVACWRR